MNPAGHNFKNRPKKRALEFDLEQIGSKHVSLLQGIAKTAA